MTRLICLAAMASLAACSPLSALTGAPGQASHSEALKGLGEHIERCDRQYQGGFGLGASFTFSIDCKAQPAAPT